MLFSLWRNKAFPPMLLFRKCYPLVLFGWGCSFIQSHKLSPLQAFTLKGCSALLALQSHKLFQIFVSQDDVSQLVNAWLQFILFWPWLKQISGLATGSYWLISFHSYSSEYSKSNWLKTNKSSKKKSWKFYDYHFKGCVLKRIIKMEW